MCRYDPAGRRECTQDGGLPACQLCPASPTYWRHTAAPAVADPWNGRPTQPLPELDMTGWREDLTPPPDPITPGHVDSLRCTLCGMTTIWISPKGARCHPSCATMWAREHALPTTPPASPTAHP